MSLQPNAKELRALRQFVSSDTTRPHMATLCAYASDGGVTYVATDGHTEVVRRSGTHRTMALYEIAKLQPCAVREEGVLFATVDRPPAWDQVLKAGSPGKLAPAYGFNPDYMARVGDVERATGNRAAEDYVPPVGMALKLVKSHKASLKNGSVATWTIPSDPLDGWFFRLETAAALWEGIVMPRRV